MLCVVADEVLAPRDPAPAELLVNRAIQREQGWHRKGREVGLAAGTHHLDQSEPPN
jgi:hypothetical protein